MKLSNIGHLAEKYWQEIPAHFPFVILDKFIVMPNHIHGIIIIDKKDDGHGVETQHNVETQNIASLQPPQPENKFGPQSQNLPSIIRGYKIGVTKNARKINPTFAWQSRYYDHIIRNDKSMQKIRTYIWQNPLNWHNDEFCMNRNT